MRLTVQQLRAYEVDGYVVVPGCFSDTEIARVQRELPAVFAEDSPRRVKERDGAVRSIYGVHATNALFGGLVRQARLVEPARQILGGEVYVYQFKINAKVAYESDLWEWHQDYIFWRNEDGMPGPHAVNAMVFLDEVTEFNGPLFVLPGSHREGVIDVAPEDSHAADDAYREGPSWVSNLIANLRYSLDKECVGTLVRRYGIASPKGPAGSVLFCNPNVVHGSPQNMSPFDRRIAIASYNRVDNAPPPRVNPRPEFIASRDTTPLPAQDGPL